MTIRNKVYDRGIYYNRTNPRFATYGGKSQYVGGIQLYKNVTSTPTSIRTATSTLGSNYYVYTIQGILLRKAASYQDAVNNLPHGVYIVNGRKVVRL